MADTCPNCAQPRVDSPECPRCGVIYARYRPRPEPVAPVIDPDDIGRVDLWTWIKDLVFPDILEINPPIFWGRVVLIAALLLWTPTFVFSSLVEADVMTSFMHRIFIVFHEAGHTIFGFSGVFLMYAGGTLGQLIMPALTIASFLKSKNPVGGAVGLWWLGTSFIDCGPYIYDAREGALPLLTGNTGAEHPETHDWFYMLGRMDLINQDHLIGWMAHLFGTTLIVIAFVWAGVCLKQQYTYLKEHGERVE